jgi:hypothetical protein
MGTGARALRRTIALLGLGAALVPAAAMAASALDLYYERSLMSAAHQRCKLFSPSVAAALDASAGQARGAALRGGVDMGVVKSVGARAASKAGSVPCASADLQTAAQRVRTAFDGWKKIARMSFPGETAEWKADRTAYRSTRWRLVQTGRLGADPTAFGVAGQGPSTALVAVARFADGAQPYTARLVFRDTARTNGAWLGAPKARPLPPRSASTVMLAQDRSAADAGIAPDARPGALAYRFPPAAAEALARLDPREQFAVEFVMADERVRTARFEVGDFAAGRAFLMVGAL